MQSVRWGVLGAAGFAERTMAPAINEACFGTLSAIATRSQDKAIPFANRAPGLEIFTSYDEMLASDSIDAVYIPLPNHMHVEWAEKAARAGKHVLCEKPLSMHANDIDRLIVASNETGKLIAEGFMPVHHPQWHLVRDKLAQGTIGKLRHIQGVFTFNNPDMSNIRNNRETGGGALYDIGVYPTVTARFATGLEPEVTSCSAIWENNVDTVARAQLMFPGEISFDFYVSMRMRLRQEMVFHGDAGLIRVNTPFNAGHVRSTHVEIWNEDGSEMHHPFPADRQYALQVEAFNRAVLNGDDFPVSLEFSKANQRVIDACLDKGRA